MKLPISISLSLSVVGTFGICLMLNLSVMLYALMSRYWSGQREELVAEAWKKLLTGEEKGERKEEKEEEEIVGSYDPDKDIEELNRSIGVGLEKIKKRKRLEKSIRIVGNTIRTVGLMLVGFAVVQLVVGLRWK